MNQGSASSVTVQRRAAGGSDLVVNGLATAEGATGLAIPVAGVVEVALERVDDAVQPRGQRRRVLLHDRVGRLPVASREQVERAAQVAIRHVSRWFMNVGRLSRRARASRGPSDP